MRQEFVALFQGVPARETVFYCGSGVTACHNLLSATHAGLPMPKLYAGSWSEWSNTPGAAHRNRNVIPARMGVEMTGGFRFKPACAGPAKAGIYAEFRPSPHRCFLVKAV